ncbi:Phage tail protein [compost metagenome]
MRLRFRERPGQYFTVRLVGEFEVERIAGTGIFSLPFTAFDPFAYADQEHIYEELVTTSPKQTNVETIGNIRTSPVIVLTNEGATTITRFKIVNEYRLEE